MPRKKVPVHLRFWDKVKKTRSCWVWQGSKHGYGYGLIRVDTKMLLTHRVCWQISRGAIPHGLQVLHRCDNPPCVRPEHLFLGTQAENVEDMVRKGRVALGERRRPERIPRGENHVRSKLTTAKVRQIRKRYATGETQDELAREFGVAQSLISVIVHRKKWVHVA